MPRSVLEFRLVVASPSDLYETRKVVFDVISELNRILETQAISIRGLGWEEYATPGISEDSQSVINKQLLSEYDILIAMFATKLGTPTPRSISGTVEEIEHAIANTTGAMGQYRVQVYFRDRIESASSISVDELKKVEDYRKQLEQKGILYRLFKDDEELRREIRTNVQRSIFAYLQQQDGAPSGKASFQPKNDLNEIVRAIPDEPPSEPISEEFGILDHLEMAEQSIQNVNTSASRIADLISEIATETNNQTMQIGLHPVSKTPS